MNIESLRFFYQIAKEGSISNIAKQAHISQSALSQQISKLETEIDARLMERSNKGVHLTSIGEIVFKYANKIITTYDQMHSAIDAFEEENILIKIKACHSIADYALPCTLMLSNKLFPKHRYALSSGTVDEIISDISNNIFDIGFTYYTAGLKIEDDNIVWTKIGRNRMVLVGKSGLPNPKQMTAEQLLNSCMITFTGENDFTETLIKTFENLGFSFNNLNCNLEVRSIESAKTLVSRGHGIAFLPYISVKEELYKKEFVQIEVPEINVDMEMIMLFNQDHTPYAQQFISWFNQKGKSSFC